MTVKTTPHLNFRGDARPALEFYQSVFGGHLVAVTYRDVGNVRDEASADQVMWGQVTGESGFAIMAYDVPASLDWNPGEIPFFVSLRGQSGDEISQYWAKLAAGATVIQPLGPAGWAPLYGMLKDRFDITWVVDVEVPYAG